MQTSENAASELHLLNFARKEFSEVRVRQAGYSSLYER
jgi:hypothetical protein